MLLDVRADLDGWSARLPGSPPAHEAPTQLAGLLLFGALFVVAPLTLGAWPALWMTLPTFLIGLLTTLARFTYETRLTVRGHALRMEVRRLGLRWRQGQWPLAQIRSIDTTGARESGQLQIEDFSVPVYASRSDLDALEGLIRDSQRLAEAAPDSPHPPLPAALKDLMSRA